MTEATPSRSDALTVKCLFEDRASGQLDEARDEKRDVILAELLEAAYPTLEGQLS